MIHKIKSGKAETFVISSHQVWLPGNYDSEKTARYAFQFPDAELLKLQKRINFKLKPITKKDLQKLALKLK